MARKIASWHCWSRYKRWRKGLSLSTLGLSLLCTFVLEASLNPWCPTTHHYSWGQLCGSQIASETSGTISEPLLPVLWPPFMWRRLQTICPDWTRTWDRPLNCCLLTFPLRRMGILIMIPGVSCQCVLGRLLIENTGSFRSLDGELDRLIGWPRT